MSYDPACHELAAKFLADYTLASDRREELTDLLAQEIQRTVEDFCEPLNDE